MRIKIIFMTAILGVAAGGFFYWKSQSTHSLVSVQRQEAKPKKQLQELRQEFTELLRSQQSIIPEQRRAAIEAWQKEHGEEMRTLQREAHEAQRKIAALNPQNSAAHAFRPPARPDNLTPEQKQMWEERQAMMGQHREMAELAQQPASPERDKKMIALQEELRASQEKMRQRMEARARQISPADQARQQELRQLMKKRSELVATLRETSPEERRKAMDAWQKENGDKLRELARPVGAPARQDAGN